MGKDERIRLTRKLLLSSVFQETTDSVIEITGNWVFWEESFHVVHLKSGGMILHMLFPTVSRGPAEEVCADLRSHLFQYFPDSKIRIFGVKRMDIPGSCKEDTWVELPRPVDKHRQRRAGDDLFVSCLLLPL